MKLTQLATCLLAAAPLVASAGSLFVTPAVTYQAFGDVLKNSTLPQVSAGYKFANNFGLEGTYNQGEVDVLNTGGSRFAGGVSADVKQYRLDGMYFLPSIAEKITPYLAAGAGELSIKTDVAPTTGRPDSGKYIQPNAGLGAMVGLTDNLKARIDARYLNWVMGTGNGGDNSTDDFQVAAGLTYDFGKKSMPVVEAPILVVPQVITPAPAPVPVDTDGDGVFDSQDQCPATPANYAVDGNGCPVELTQPVSIPLQVLFDTNKSVVKPEFGAEIAKVAEFMTVYPKSTAVIEGHTDNRGSNALNQKLSQLRADAIRNALVEGFGIDPARISAMGYGEDKPIADNATPAGRDQNRRVSAVITGEQRVVKTR